MAKIAELYQSADWKKEKHSPVIEIEKKGDAYQITASIGKEISHPNTTEHFIAWIEVYFYPEGAKFPYQIGRFDFAAHGASTDGPNSSTVYTDPFVTCVMKSEKGGTVVANSYCNIHGLWTSEAELK